MKNWKRLLYYLLINACVSACVTWVVLTVWVRMHPQSAGIIDPLSLILKSPTPAEILADLPVASLTPSMNASATEALLMYQVKQDETLSEIAERFGVSVEKLLALNGITDPKSLGNGQVIFIPKIISTETQVPQPTVIATSSDATPAPPEQASEVVIRNVFGAGDLSTERVRLQCKGQGPASLSGWKLQDENGHVFTFPQLVLYPDGAVDIHTAGGVNDVASLYWGLQEAIWTTGETVSLLDQQGNVRATYIVP